MKTRDKIVETASKLFYEQGYNSTGINQVIKEAGIAKASLYAHFASKEDLLKEYLRSTAITTNEILKSVIDKQESPREKVLSLFDFLINFSKDTEFNGCHFLNISSEIPKNNESVKLLIKNQKDKIRLLFVDILKPIGKEDLADELYILFEGAVITSKVYEDIWTIKTTRKIVEKLL